MTVEIQEQALWLIPAGLAIYFMLWVLWGLLREQWRPNRVTGRMIRAEFILPNARHSHHDRLLRH